MVHVFKLFVFLCFKKPILIVVLGCYMTSKAISELFSSYPLIEISNFCKLELWYLRKYLFIKALLLRVRILSKNNQKICNVMRPASSIRWKRAKDAVRAASLKVEIEFIEKEAEFKRLQVMKELAKAKTEEAIMKRMEEEIAKESVISKLEDNKVEFDNDMEAYFNANKYRVTMAKEPV